MVKATLVGAAMALAVMSSSSIRAETVGVGAAQRTTAAEGAVVITSAQIARLKSVLKLTPAQEQHWRPLEAVLRDIARQQAPVRAASAGMVQRLSNRAAAFALDSGALRRLMAAALPLIHSLNEDQKRQALTFAKAIGLSAVSAL